MIRQIIASLLMLGNTQPILEKVTNEAVNTQVTKNFLSTYNVETTGRKKTGTNTETYEDEYIQIEIKGYYEIMTSTGGSSNSKEIYSQTEYENQTTNNQKILIKYKAKKSIYNMQIKVINENEIFYANDTNTELYSKYELLGKILTGMNDMTMDQIYNNPSNIPQYVSMETETTTKQYTNENPDYYAQNEGILYNAGSYNNTTKGYVVFGNTYYTSNDNSTRIDAESNLNGLRLQLNYVTQIATSVEVIDMPNIMWTLLTMPFTFISIAFNLTLWPGTPYAINISNLVLVLLAIFIFIFVMSIIIKASRNG